MNICLFWRTIYLTAYKLHCLCVSDKWRHKTHAPDTSLGGTCTWHFTGRYTHLTLHILLRKVKFRIKAPADMSPFCSLWRVQLRTGVLWRGAVSLGEQLPTFRCLLTQQRSVTSPNTESSFTQLRQHQNSGVQFNVRLLELSYSVGTNI
jgi:hypothetical protein